MPGVPFPPSLNNIFKEANSDVGIKIPKSGSLVKWNEEGVLLLNTLLTVEKGKAFSHKQKGWEQFTDAIIKTINKEKDYVVFLLWGRPAQTKKKLLNTSKHTIIENVHPSPLSASRGFFGCKAFSKCNDALIKHGKDPINWNLE